MRRKFTVATILLIALMQLCQPPAPAAVDKSKQLQRAVDLIDSNPRLAEAKLLAIKGATANVYLAFLYMSHKVPTPHAAKKIDSLMNSAISTVPDGYALGDVKSSQHYHYTSMDMFLTHLRFITDADGQMVNVPNSIFEQYPEAAFDAFRPYWGSTRDSFLPLQISKQRDVREIKSVAAFLQVLGEMCGDPGSNCTGTIRYHFYRTQALAEDEASLAPQLFIERDKDPDAEVTHLQLDRFLRTWANEELWNNQEYEQLNRTSKAAEMPLAAFYRKRFKVTQAQALEQAKAALAGLRLGYLGEYSSSSVDDTRATPVYQIFSSLGLALTEMHKQLPAEALTKDQLAQALRLAILNGARPDVIDWLIKQGAPVRGGKESPLFTAVLRPEVVSALLKAGADANEINTVGKTALIQAAQFNAGDTIKLLVAAGADVNHSMVKADAKEAQDANATCEFNYTVGSRTPLMYAAAFSDSANISYLLSKGSDKSAVDSNGKKARNYLSWNKKLSKADSDQLLQTLAR